MALILLYQRSTNLLPCLIIPFHLMFGMIKHFKPSLVRSKYYLLYNIYTHNTNNNKHAYVNNCNLPFLALSLSFPVLFISCILPLSLYYYLHFHFLSFFLIKKYCLTFSVNSLTIKIDIFFLTVVEFVYEVI